MRPGDDNRKCTNCQTKLTKVNQETDYADWWVQRSWLWFVALVPALLFSNGRWQFALAALATPFLARLFLFSQPVVKGLLVFFVIQISAYLIMWWEVIPAPGLLYYVIAAAYGLCYFLPFVADRLVSKRFAGFASTLVLPLAWYLVEVLIQIFTPYGSWSSAGYTQMGHGVLTPLAAWVGVDGIAFVTIWIGTVASWIVVERPHGRKRRLTLIIWAVSVAALALLARIPYGDDQPDSKLVVAAITPSSEATLRVDRAVQEARRAGEFDDAVIVKLQSAVSELNDELFDRSRKVAREGARLVVWSETAARALGDWEDRLVIRGQQLARDEGIFLFLGLGVLHPGRQPPYENKVIAITPTGEVAWHYRKARPIVGSEAPFLPPGHDDLAVLDADFGRVGLVICHDLDFADFVVQAGQKNVDLLLAPSADWLEIADLHAKMGVMRAVENGFWLLRPVHDGLTVIASPSGRVVRSIYDIENPERVLSGEIRPARSATAFPYLRPYLPFVALGLFIVLLIRAFRH